MNRCELGTIGPLRGLPQDRIVVDVPIDSPEYQAFLEANRLREQSREEHGGPDPKAEEGYREAVEVLSKFSRVLYAQNRAS